jgi:hypothetical protein
MANPQSFIAFADMALSLGKSRVVVLSGDVHYSFSVTAKIASAKSTVEVLQLTSSALKNEEPEIRQRLVRSLDHIEKTASLALWWARGDTNIAILNDYTRFGERHGGRASRGRGRHGNEGPGGATVRGIIEK